jgi:hypothetical protein
MSGIAIIDPGGNVLAERSAYLAYGNRGIGMTDAELRL